MFYRCFFCFFFCFFVLFPSVKKYKTTFLGNGGTDFHEILPNDSGENVVSNVLPKWGLGPI